MFLSIFPTFLISLFRLYINQLTEATPIGKTGRIVLFPVEEENALVTVNVPTLYHSMMEKAVRTLDHQLRRTTAITRDVQVYRACN